jgi:hypothetical protein
MEKFVILSRIFDNDAHTKEYSHYKEVALHMLLLSMLYNLAIAYSCESHSSSHRCLELPDKEGDSLSQPLPFQNRGSEDFPLALVGLV